MRLLVTGASGLFGSKLCKLTTGKSYDVYSAYHQHKPLHGTPIQFDVSYKNAVEKAFKQIKPEAVVHAAALTDLDKCEVEKELAWRVNVKGTEHVVKSCKRHRVFLVYISTDYVFDGEKGMYKETDRPAPINYYGLTKLESEESVRNSMDEYCIARTSVIYGSIPATGKANFALWLLHKLKRNEEAKIVTDQWNSPTLNTNLASMILEILEQEMTGIYHVAGASRINRYDFSKLIAQAFDLDTGLIVPSLSKQISWVAQRPRDSSLNIAKAHQMLNNKPLKIKQGIEKMKREIEASKMNQLWPFAKKGL